MQKPDAEKILAHVEHIKEQPWLTKSQQWWPDYLFHFTDILNAVKILKEGVMLSRSQLEKNKELITDIASKKVIETTELKWKNYVRLYFRPRTPTQYSNEGFRPKDQRRLESHCPVPIFFIFDAKNIMTNQETVFSDGNLAAGARTGETSDFFLSLPFGKIYHDREISEEEKRNIIFHRHAEVIIPKSLDLSYLKLIWCRSQAEFETLLYLLPAKIRQKWQNKIGVGSKPRLFYANWAFITKVDLSTSSISFTFNPSFSSGPFDAKLEVVDINTKNVYARNKKDFYAKETLSFDLPNMVEPIHYTVMFQLDDHLAYQNGFIEELEVPF